MAAAPKFDDLAQLFERAVRRHGERPLFGTKTGGQWAWTTYREIDQQVSRCRAGLAARGIAPGDRIALIANNRVEWAVTAYAAYGLGATVVPMYEAQHPAEWEFIVRDCEAVAVVAATTPIVNRCRPWLETVPSLRQVIGFDLPRSDPDSYRGLLAGASDGGQAPAAIAPTDVASLIYTSGTTGKPKGVVLTHANLCSNVTALHAIMPLGTEDRSVSSLPWAHGFGHTCELHAMVSLGASIALCESADKVLESLAEVHPTTLISVPRLFNRIYATVHQEMRQKPRMMRQLFRRGLAAAERRRQGRRSLTDQALWTAADRLIFSRVRAQVGGRLRYAFSGGARLSTEVAQLLDHLGIVVYEGYGLTETSPVVTANRPGARRIGSVGQPIPAVAVHIDDSVDTDRPEQGEVLVRGPNVTPGYFRRDEDNRDLFSAGPDGDRYLRTGDVGYVDRDGYLHITGRVKEQYKLLNGKYVAPSPLEDALRLSPLIANAMIYGDNREYNVALIVPDLDALDRWATEQGMRCASTAALLDSELVKARVLEEVDERCKESRPFERVRKIALIEENFSTQNGLLTPSLRIKRRAVMKRYGQLVDDLYEADAGA
ncbi:MAG: long-chain fatty acid--CoA ligase [Deltaproteobacteria bacterium]|jgi:long-chain acyl-CoA synthetase|nr:long-chain fatty acid--CoA ligase [Deltaproteobacteria bacterium]MBW2531675.1 long-chain fatty acid--CoA ligase [Deltaproteobacteria bacterium]